MCFLDLYEYTDLCAIQIYTRTSTFSRYVHGLQCFSDLYTDFNVFRICFGFLHGLQFFFLGGGICTQTEMFSRFVHELQCSSDLYTDFDVFWICTQTSMYINDAHSKMPLSAVLMNITRISKELIWERTETGRGRHVTNTKWELRCSQQWTWC